MIESLGALSPFISEEKIQEKVQKIAQALSEQFKDSQPVVVGVLNGSFVFYSDLIRAMSIDIVCDFCGVSSYGMAAQSSGEARMTLDVQSHIKGRDVILVEDIVDTGITMNFLKDHFRARGVKSLTTVSLLLKPEALKVDCPLDQVGFEIGNDFVVGYGLDYQGYYRSLPYIAQIQNMN